MPLPKSLAFLVLAFSLAVLSPPAAATAVQDKSATPVRRLVAALDLQPEPAWVLRQETPTELVWLTPEKLLVSVRAAPPDPSIVDSFSGLARMQDYFRKEAVALHAGLVEAVILQGRPRYYGMVTIKFPVTDDASGDQSARRYAYDIGALFPVADGLGMLSVTAKEVTTAQSRAALAVGDTPAHTRSATRPHDPYDSRYDAGALYFDADSRTWDASMPQNPLSQARALMTRLLATAPIADGDRR